MAEQKLKNREQEIDALVVLVKGGDVDAFSKLYDIFITPLYRYIYYKVHKDDVEDLTEMVFLKIWENIHRYEKGVYSFSAWVFRIAKNLVIDHYRLFKATSELTEQVADTREHVSPKVRVERELTKEHMKVAMTKLKENHREILLLKFMQDLRNEEIAEMLDKTEGSLRILQFRALKALRKILSGMGIKDVL
jgi:RNA polymerase sigma-70 factor, ECF subfamily